MQKRKTVFFTGASGSMGMATLKKFLESKDEFDVRILVRPSKKNKKKMQKYASKPSVEIVWGDMTDRETIFKCVEGVDYVLHIGAMISPMADQYPELTMKTNYGSTLHIIEAIKAQKNADDIGFVYIGTVAETGCRMAPIHWGRCGDPLKGSMFDNYATSKIASERAVFESGLNKWVSLRQTGILPYNRSAGDEPIIFHQSPNNVLEWITAVDSGNLMVKVCGDNIPNTFWRKAYNIGGGEKWRLTHLQLNKLTLGALGITYQEIYDARDIAQYNFHGQWYTDSDTLNDTVKFRTVDGEAYFEAEYKKINRLTKIPLIKKLLPTAQQINDKNLEISKKEMGTQWMRDNRKEEWVKAFFGSCKNFGAIKTWEEGYELVEPSKTPTYLNHGYDEAKPTEQLSIEDMQGVAKFRGGKCLSQSMINGDLFTSLKWQCANGHTFSATPNLVLKGGHWCPQCEREAWDFAAEAKVNPFFAQVWTPLHGDEDAVRIEKPVSDMDV